MSLAKQAGALALVGLVITILVYGLVAVIVKLDDIGLHLATKADPVRRAIGRGLVLGVPKLLTGLAAVGTAAMLWVGGQILIHGIEEMGFGTIPHLVHDLSHGGAELVGFAPGLVTFALEALAGAIVGLIVGGVILGIKHVIPWPGNKVTADQASAH
jgi:predicted DNA repair protein MutK